MVVPKELTVMLSTVSTLDGVPHLHSVLTSVPTLIDLSIAFLHERERNKTHSPSKSISPARAALFIIDKAVFVALVVVIATLSVTIDPSARSMTT